MRSWLPRSLRHEQHGGESRFLPWVILLGLLVGGASYWSSNKEVLGLFGDDGIYAVVAKSLSEGAGYRLISLPTAPDQTKYPFLYSYILSWLWNLDPNFPDNIGLLKAANAAFLTTSFILSYLFYRSRVEGEESEGLLFAALVCINPTVFSLADFTISDILFLLILLSAFVICRCRGKMPFAARQRHTDRCYCRSRLSDSLSGFTVRSGWSSSFRVGQALSRFDATMLCLVLLLIAPWWLWVGNRSNQTASSLLEYYVSYSSFPPAFVTMWSDPFGAIEIVWGNLRYIVEALDLIFQSRIVPGLLLPVALLLLFGLWRSFNYQSVFFRSYLVLYFGLVIALPFPSARYLVPLAPAIYFFLFRGVHAAEIHLGELMTSETRKKIVYHLVRVTFALVVVLHVGWIFHYLFSKDVATTRVWYGERLPASWRGFSETFEWIRSHTDHETILATSYDPMYYLYTGRRAVQPALYKAKTYFYPYGRPVPDMGSPAEIRAELKSLGVRFLVIHPLNGSEEQDAHSKFCNELIHSYRTPPELVFTSSDSKHRIYALPQE